MATQQAQRPGGPEHHRASAPGAAPVPDAAVDGPASQGAATEAQTVKKRRGQSSTMLTSPLGVTTTAPAPKTLVGG